MKRCTESCTGAVIKDLLFSPVGRLQKRVYRFLRTRRFRTIERLLDPQGRTLLDVGCEDLFFFERLKHRYRVTPVDLKPCDPIVLRTDVQDLPFPDRSFDIVLCQQVLEHVADPVRAMRELRRVAARQLIITVPYEPFYSLVRGWVWEKEHLWTVSPGALSAHLGRPRCGRAFCLRRYYAGVW